MALVSPRREMEERSFSGFQTKDNLTSRLLLDVPSEEMMSEHTQVVPSTRAAVHTDTTQDQLYEYSPLPLPNSASIRLSHLNDSETNEISGSLEVVDLTDQSIYPAVS